MIQIIQVIFYYLESNSHYLYRIKHTACLFGWWLVLICSERKVLLTDCWWLVCSERKILLAGG
jgi:hypothetical protein